MHIDDLLDERERLIRQRANILQAMGPPVLASDLSHDGRDALRIDVAQALDDAFFPLLDPLESEIEEHEAASAWIRQRAELVTLRRRQ